ncbi:T9SS type A sorting domain-containing protein [Faecalibacter sp. LW9]|uniref:T9SS type A sorting domain-containing protein n=1 Tax=Faecalibacter sp. LW9 TaxID=3103144 RepID=UPI002AFDD428|nr:T9SS type A sorting domain-containing protein [Faecalibacter sp. LW9]
MKNLLLPILLTFTSYTYAQTYQGCIDAPNGLYPENIYIPNCGGNIEYITEYGFSGEYSKVQLSAGIAYEFKGSIHSDYLTITDESGDEILVSGSNIVNFTPMEDMIIRFYLHTNENCGSDFDDLKMRSIKCTSVPTSYCAPILDCSDGAAILEVSTSMFTHQSDCSENGYIDYSGQYHIPAYFQEPIDLSVKVGNGWYEQSVSVWIDFNRNFQFEENEFYFLGSGTNTTINGIINIPEHIEIGEYHMRIRLSTVSENHATWDKACDVSEYYGETEDYMLLYTHPISTNEIEAKKVRWSPNPVHDQLMIQNFDQVNTIIITDLIGKTILKTESKAKINVEKLPKGVYVIQLLMKDGTEQKSKMIKK